MLDVYYDDEFVDYDTLDAIDTIDAMDYDDNYSVSQRRRSGYCATYVNIFNPRIRRRICYRRQRNIRTIIRDHTGTYRLRRVRFVFDCRDCHRPGSGRPPFDQRPYSSDFTDEF